MTSAEKQKLRVVFNSLSEDEKNRDIAYIAYNKFEKVLNEKESISIEISDSVQNLSMFTGYSGVVNLLRVSKGEVALKPRLIKELLF